MRQLADITILAGFTSNLTQWILETGLNMCITIILGILGIILVSVKIRVERKKNKLLDKQLQDGKRQGKEKI
jgi:hypothetical protein